MVAIKVIDLASHNRIYLLFLDLSRLIGEPLKRAYDGKRIPRYVHVDVIVGLAMLNPGLPFFDDVFFAALIEMLRILAAA